MMLLEGAGNLLNKKDPLRGGVGQKRKNIQPENDLSYFPTATSVG